MVIMNLVLHNTFKDVDYLNPLAILDEKAMLAFRIDLLLLVLRTTMTIVAYIVAKRLMRSGIFWAILVFLFPPISLIILGLMDIKIDSNLKKNLDHHRTNYFVETVKIKNDYKNGVSKENNLKDMIEGCKRKHQELLTKALYARNIEIENNKIVDWMHDATKCPACGTKVDLKDKICPNCELYLE
ncbi:hypothetical protein CDL62_14600 [Alkalitalea saponilacus]|nr:hypothetical protein CDL62_14600 [Alkalitalea saponilacus]